MDGVAGDRQGNVYNVNADQRALACASGFRADNLAFLTDVEGVRGADDGSTISMLDIAECRRVEFQDGIATCGNAG